MDAIIRRLAYWLLISEDAEQLNKVSAIADAFDNNQFHNAKTALIKGEGLGQRFVSSYSPSLKRQQVDGAIAHLKTTGLMAGIVSKINGRGR